MNKLNNKQKTYLIFFISLFISLIFNTFILNDKQVIDSNISNLNSITIFKEILTKNTICFLWILSGIIIGKVIVYIFLTINGLIIGLLISKFSSIKYLLLIVPHGIVEFSCFLLLSILVLDILIVKKISKIDIKLIVLYYAITILAVGIESFITPYIVEKFLC